MISYILTICLKQASLSYLKTLLIFYDMLQLPKISMHQISCKSAKNKGIFQQKTNAFSIDNSGSNKCISGLENIDVYCVFQFQIDTFLKDYTKTLIKTAPFIITLKYLM